MSTTNYACGHNFFSEDDVLYTELSTKFCPGCRGEKGYLKTKPISTPAAPTEAPKAELPKWNEILLKFREYRKWMDEQIHWLAQKWTDGGDTRYGKEMLELLQPSGTAPKEEIAGKPEPETDLDCQLAICEQNGTKWAHFKVAEIAKLRAERDAAKHTAKVELIGKLQTWIGRVGHEDYYKLSAMLLQFENRAAAAASELSKLREATIREIIALIRSKEWDLEYVDGPEDSYFVFICKKLEELAATLGAQDGNQTIQEGPTQNGD